jgi:hypothetical protein
MRDRGNERVRGHDLMREIGIMRENSSGHPDGADPTKHNFSNFTQYCKILLQICVKCLTIL